MDRTRDLLSANQMLSQTELQAHMVDKVGIEPTSRGGVSPAFHNATYPYKFLVTSRFVNRASAV